MEQDGETIVVQAAAEFLLGEEEDFPFSIAMSDPRVDDNPLVYVNRSFEVLTGYARSAVIGRNCRFLQGEDTDRRVVRRLSEAMSHGREVTADILNYRADGSTFMNRLHIMPLYNKDGEIDFFLGIQAEIDPTKVIDPPEKSADEALIEIQHRVKNHLSMIVGMIRLQSRDRTAASSFKTLARRVESLQLLYEEMSNVSRKQSSNSDMIALGAYLSRIASAISHIDGRSGILVNVDLEAMSVPIDTAVRIGLLVSEIMTNSMQHAFRGRDSGFVSVNSRSLSGGAIRIQVQDDGVGLPDGVRWPDVGNLGGKIVRKLVEGLGAKMDVARAAQGVIVTLDIPARARERT